MIALGLFAGSSVGLRHALAHAEVLRRRCVVNGEPAFMVAKSLGLDEEQTVGAVRLLKAHPLLSPERLALVVMRDPGLDDEDIAEIFGRSVRWARVVREQADEIRSEEPVELELEYVESGLQPGDPNPEQIAEIVREIRKRPSNRRDMAHGSRIRVYSWRNDAFVCEGFD